MLDEYEERSFVYVPERPARTHVVKHDLDARHPLVQTFDQSGNVASCAVHVQDVNTVSVTPWEPTGRIVEVMKIVVVA